MRGRLPRPGAPALPPRDDLAPSPAGRAGPVPGHLRAPGVGTRYPVLRAAARPGDRAAPDAEPAGGPTQARRAAAGLPARGTALRRTADIRPPRAAVCDPQARERIRAGAVAAGGTAPTRA